MARAMFVKAARKKIPENVCGIKGGIKKGQSYYWWKFRRGGKHWSLTSPRRSQLTASAFYATLYDIQDTLAAVTDKAELESARDEAAEALRELASEQEEKRSNMPEPLQEGPTGELLQERQSACEAAADALDAVDVEDGDVESVREELNAAAEVEC